MNSQNFSAKVELLFKTALGNILKCYSLRVMIAVLHSFAGFVATVTKRHVVAGRPCMFMLVK